MSIFQKCRGMGVVCCLMLLLLDVEKYLMMTGIKNTDLFDIIPLEYRAFFVMCAGLCFLTWVFCDVIFGLIGVVGQFAEIHYTRFKFRKPVRVYPPNEK